jgi:hypothetical protein
VLLLRCAGPIVLHDGMTIGSAARNGKPRQDPDEAYYFASSIHSVELSAAIDLIMVWRSWHETTLEGGVDIFFSTT